MCGHASLWSLTSTEDKSQLLLLADVVEACGFWCRVSHDFSPLMALMGLSSSSLYVTVAMLEPSWVAVQDPPFSQAQRSWVTASQRLHGRAGWKADLPIPSNRKVPPTARLVSCSECNKNNSCPEWYKSVGGTWRAFSSLASSSLGIMACPYRELRAWGKSLMKRRQCVVLT